ncbi:hypothetical protein FSP39_001260 [Pinctada imbricata]|uniref:Uncharacterized protein n=1 Tax=Pinctada imbricata TaxID=66713 RepID=A0AA88YS23_PINIB|nr:hypothetical protein FSP39_001260 [Pinctada imbricata]
MPDWRLRQVSLENLTKPEDFIQSSKMDSFNLQACVEVENMLYIEVFSLLSKYEKEPSIELRDRILLISDNGLQFLEDEDEFSRLFWRRMFLIRMTYCLFGLSMKFQRIPGCYIDHESIHRGKRYLAEIDKCWDGIESRRKIWYYVARARQYELECDMRSMETAIWFVDQAIDLATKGNFSEINFAIDYKNGLLSQMGNLEADECVRDNISCSSSYLFSKDACETEDRSSVLKTEQKSWQSHDSEMDENNDDPEIFDENKSMRWDLHATDSTFFNKKTKSYLESLVQETKGRESILYSLERSNVDTDSFKSDLDSCISSRKGGIEHEDSDQIDSIHLSSGLFLDDEFQSLDSNITMSKDQKCLPKENEFLCLNFLSFDSIALSEDRNQKMTLNESKSIHPSAVQYSSICDNDPVENSFEYDFDYIRIKLQNLTSEIKSIFSYQLLDRKE